MVYLQYAEGFRIGRFQTPLRLDLNDPDGNGLINFVDGQERQVDPGILEPDNVDSYEFGLKTTLADGRLTLDASVFYVDWTGIPVGLASVGSGTFFFNAGEATSEGVELQTQWIVSDGLVLDLSSSYVETVLAEDAPGLGEKGDDLPGSADFNFSLGLERQFSVDEYDGFVRADYVYISEYYHFFSRDSDDPVSGGYSQVHLNAGVAVNDVSIEVYAKNLLNTDEYVWVNPVWNGEGRGFALRPRTIGINLSYNF